jgi:hypothetical protein
MGTIHFRIASPNLPDSPHRAPQLPVAPHGAQQNTAEPNSSPIPATIVFDKLFINNVLYLCDARKSAFQHSMRADHRPMGHWGSQIGGYVRRVGSHCLLRHHLSDISSGVCHIYQHALQTACQFN